MSEQNNNQNSQERKEAAEKAAKDNRSKQLNPQDPTYTKSRGSKPGKKG